MVYGYTFKSFGESTDFLAVAQKPDGSLTWASIYGGTNLDELKSAIRTKDGGSLMVGDSQSLFFTPLKVMSPNKPARALAIKIDHEGVVQWAISLDYKMGSSDHVNTFHEAVEMADGSLMLVGSADLGMANDPSQYQVAVMKVSPEGKAQWIKGYKWGNSNTSLNAARTPEGRLMMAAFVWDPAEKRAKTLLLEVDGDGNVHSARLVAAPKNHLVYDLRVFEDGGLLMAGGIETPDRQRDFFAARFAPSGKALWARSFGTSGDDEARHVIRGFGDTTLLVGRGRKLEKGYASGMAVLLNPDGHMTAAVFIPPLAEFTDAVLWPPRSYRLFGHMERTQGTRYLDIMEATWDPTKASAAVLATITEADVPVDVKDAVPSARALKVLVTSLPPDLLFVRRLQTEDTPRK